MRFECPGCGETTPDVVAEGGKPVYCTQCGRGFRFIYGFYHRYLYFVFNHPVLTFALLLIFALMLASSFRGPLQLLYLAFYTVFYWTVFRWVQRSHKYLETLPTGPDVARDSPHAPKSAPPRPAPLTGARPPKTEPPLIAAPKVGVPVAPKTPRLSFFAVGAFILSLIVFPFALFAGFASLPAVTGLLLSLVHKTGGAGDFVDFLVDLDLASFRTVVAVYVFGVVLTSLFFLGLNILALSVVRSRKNRGKELVIWAFVFWFISTLLLGSQVVSGFHVMTDWQAQERMIQSSGPVPAAAFELRVPAIRQWTLMHAWRSNADPRKQLRFFRRVLDRDEVQYDRNHEWIPRGMAIRLGTDAIRDMARRSKESGASPSPTLITVADEFCLAVIKAMAEDPDRAIRRTAQHALMRLSSLPFELPNSEKRMTDKILSTPRRSARAYMSNYMINFGSGKSVLAKALQFLRSDEITHDPAWLGSLLRNRNNQDEVTASLTEMFKEADTPSARRRIILAAAAVQRERGLTPILVQGLQDRGEVRYRSLQALYRLFDRRRLPDDLRRVRQYYYRYRKDSRNFGGSKYESVHRATARGWISYLRSRYPDLVYLPDGDDDGDY
jgi:hypothetical protein